jgi:hypothetical protein
MSLLANMRVIAPPLAWSIAAVDGEKGPSSVTPTTMHGVWQVAGAVFLRQSFMQRVLFWFFA